MEDINLNEYFEGSPADRKCPSQSCPHVSETDIELRDHLWTHREAEADRPISKKERSKECPHPKCEGIIFHSSILRHIGTHTGKKPHACPHLISWGPHGRELCGHRALQSFSIRSHRETQHGYNSQLGTATDPWVEPANIALSDAELHFSDRAAKPEPMDGDDARAPHANAQGDAPAVGNQVPQPQPQPHVPPPPAGAHPAPGAHQQGAAFAGMNHGPQGPFPGAHGQPHAVPGGPLHLRRVEVTRISHIPHPLGHIVTEIEKRTYA